MKKLAFNLETLVKARPRLESVPAFKKIQWLMKEKTCFQLVTPWVLLLALRRYVEGAMQVVMEHETTRLCVGYFDEDIKVRGGGGGGGGGGAAG